MAPDVAVPADKALDEALKFAGVKVSGEAALAILNREDVDLMLLDVRLPGIDGFDVLRIVRENYSLIEVIMISAINEVETAVQAMKHGAKQRVGL